MKKGRKYLSIFLLFLLGNILLPKELIHEFFHQEETCDVICSPGDGPEIGPEHRHCDILQLSSPPLYCSAVVFHFHLNVLENIAPVYKVSDNFCVYKGLHFLRGPPVFVS
ncbi:MAG: hypothetical protein IPQ03_06340 [Bacteroidetes bacterium]|nr:hypothetical protein [Bacteroidota bacterium]MBK9542879.1 hypothetical protein [Bacteroidota bacterium]MBL0257154.1 hypothetical protein [Bacteroidota bacterium]MBP6401497.1 hypothetical protein [Bacteroidia bacterium]MBP6649049.1 hypothetical protein [Bacteroidia bacterium]